MKYKKYLKKAAAAVSVAAVGITTVMAPMAVSAKTAEDMGLTLENVQANDYVLYTVNCGTPDPSVIPNQDSERLGLLQSNVDQEYGEDPETGITWGRNPANEYSQAVNSGDDQEHYASDAEADHPLYDDQLDDRNPAALRRDDEHHPGRPGERDDHDLAVYLQYPVQVFA